MEMENKYTIYYVLIGALILGGAVAFMVFRSGALKDSKVVELTATSTTEEFADVMATSTDEEQEMNQTSEVAVTSSTGGGEGTASPQTVNLADLIPHITLGPRVRADSPSAALKYFAEAIAGDDVERALSYMRADVQEQYRAAFETHYQTKPHPVVVAYYNGTVKDSKLIEPKYGWYEIDVYPSGSTLPYKIYAEYDSSVGAFVLTEL